MNKAKLKQLSMAKSLVILVLALVATASVALAYNGVAEIVVEGDMNYQQDSGEKLGGVVFEREIFANQMVVGGSVKTTTGTSTLSSVDVCDSTLIRHDPTSTTTTLTLPSASEMITYCLPSAGDRIEILVENTGGSSETVTIAAGTNIDLQEPDGQNVIIGQNNYANLTLVNTDGSTIFVEVDETIPAD